jgi:hypothetical protein
MLPFAMQMNVPAKGGMKQNYLSFLKALLLTSATQRCRIENHKLVTKNSLIKKG